MPKLTNIGLRPQYCQTVPFRIQGALFMLNRNQARLRALLRQRPVNVTEVRKQRRAVMNAQRMLNQWRDFQRCCDNQIGTLWGRRPPHYELRPMVDPRACRVGILSAQRRTYSAMRGLGQALGAVWSAGRAAKRRVTGRRTDARRFVVRYRSQTSSSFHRAMGHGAAVATAYRIMANPSNAPAMIVIMQEEVDEAGVRVVNGWVNCGQGWVQAFSRRTGW